jgi:hypothetical protein
MSGKFVALLILGGSVLTGTGFGAGYLVFREDTKIKTTAAASPTSDSSPTPSPTPSPAPSPSPSPTQSLIPQNMSVCTNTVGGYQLGYPPEWVTTHKKPEWACWGIDIVPHMDLEDYPGPVVFISAQQQAETAESWVKQKTAKGYAGNVTKNEPATLAGLPATLLELTIDAPNQACIGPRETACFRIVPQSSKEYGYVADRGGKAFLLTLVVSPSGLQKYGEYQAILEKSAATVKFF